MDRAAAPATCNCFAIRRAARHVSQFYDGHLASSGLKTTQFSVLVRLSKAGPLAIGELAAAMTMDRTTMGRALRPLERDGLVRIAPGRDGRTRALHLTDEGPRPDGAGRPPLARGADRVRDRLRNGRGRRPARGARAG